MQAACSSRTPCRLTALRAAPPQYPLCLSLLASGRVDVRPLVTHRFPFSAEGIAAGFGTAATAAASGAIKVMFNL